MNIDVKNEDQSNSNDQLDDRRFKIKFQSKKKTFKFGQKSIEDKSEEKPEENKAVKKFIQLDRKFKANDRSVDNKKKYFSIGKVKPHALSANKDENNLDELGSKPNFLKNGSIRK